MLELNMLVQAALGAVAFGTVINRAFVVARNLGRRPPMSLLFLVVNLKRHIKHLLMLPLIGLQAIMTVGTYLESVEFVTEILLLVKQLLEPVGQNDVSVVKPAILLVKMMVIVYYFILAAFAGGFRDKIVSFISVLLLVIALFIVC